VPRSLSLRVPNGRRLLAAVAIALMLAVAARVWSRGSSQAAPTTDQTRLGPVILVPGYGGGTASLDVLAARLPG